MSSRQQLRLVLEALVETVHESGPNGAPAGPMYAAMMPIMSLDTFEQFMSALVANGNLRKEGHVYHFVKSL